MNVVLKDIVKCFSLWIQVGIEREQLDPSLASIAQIEKRCFTQI